MGKGKEFLKQRILANVERLLDEGFQEINISVSGSGFIINPTKKIRKSGDKRNGN